jgi:cleavage and polyadenylation specificity factor subunit 4
MVLEKSINRRYNRGFCKHGPNCRNKHVRKVACQIYLTGFCPRGPDCERGHPKFELPRFEDEPVTHVSSFEANAQAIEGSR